MIGWIIISGQLNEALYRDGAKEESNTEEEPYVVVEILKPFSFRLRRKVLQATVADQQKNKNKTPNTKRPAEWGTVVKSLDKWPRP